MAMLRQVLSGGARLAAGRSVLPPVGLLRSTPASARLAQQPCWGQSRGFADKSGVVKFFNPEKGFGFIQSEDQDYFVHYTGIESAGGFRSLADGEEVDFDVEVDDRGKTRAVRVTGPGGAAVKGSQRQQEYAGEGGGQDRY